MASFFVFWIAILFRYLSTGDRCSLVRVELL